MNAHTRVSAHALLRWAERVCGLGEEIRNIRDCIRAQVPHDARPGWVPMSDGLRAEIVHDHHTPGLLVKHLVAAGDAPFPLVGAPPLGLTVSARAIVDYMRLAGGLADELDRAEALLVARIGPTVTDGRVALGEGQLVAIVAPSSPRGDGKPGAGTVVVTVYDASEDRRRNGHKQGACGNAGTIGRNKARQTRRMRPYRRDSRGGEEAA